MGLAGSLRLLLGRSASSVSLWFTEDGGKTYGGESLTPGKDGGAVRKGFLFTFEKQELWKPRVAGPRVPSAGEQNHRKRVMEIQ